MRVHLPVILSVVVAGFALLSVAGCGGGGGMGLNWDTYSPPADVIAPAQLEQVAMQSLFDFPRTLFDAPNDVWMFTYGRIPAADNVILQLLQETFGGLIGLLPLEAKNIPAELRIMQLLNAAATAPAQVGTAQWDDLAFDWTDPDFGIHWTGVVREEGGRLRPELTGIGPNANCTIAFQIIIEAGSRARLSGTMSGMLPAQVDRLNVLDGTRTTTDGRAEVDGSLFIELLYVPNNEASLQFNYDMAGDYQVNEGGIWTTVNQSEGRNRITGSIEPLAGFVLNLDTDYYSGDLVGDSLFWARHQITGTAQAIPVAAPAQLPSTDPEDWDANANVTDNVTYSNGMAGRLTFSVDTDDEEAGGQVTGFLNDPAGTSLLTITGSLALDNPVTIHWADGHDQVVDWLGFEG